MSNLDKSCPGIKQIIMLLILYQLKYFIVNNPQIINNFIMSLFKILIYVLYNLLFIVSFDFKSEARGLYILTCAFQCCFENALHWGFGKVLSFLDIKLYLSK